MNTLFIILLQFKLKGHEAKPLKREKIPEICKSVCD